MSGPALFDLVAYFLGGYVVVPAVGALLATRKRGLSPSTRLLVSAVAAVVGALAGYGALMVIEPRLARSVLNLAIGPAVGTVIAIAIAFVTAERVPQLREAPG